MVHKYAIWEYSSSYTTSIAGIDIDIGSYHFPCTNRGTLWEKRFAAAAAAAAVVITMGQRLNNRSIKKIRLLLL